MLKSIQRLRQFGVFDDFSKTPLLSEFAEKNIIFGWNYSGKTTLSRLFGILATKSISSDFKGATFAITDKQGKVITEADLHAHGKTVEVFNSDFVAANLSWTGNDFQPILLLGEESIEAEAEIDRLTKQVERCRLGYANKRNGISAINQRLSDAKTVGAKAIKTTLQLVDAFTATHLSGEISQVAVSPETWLLSDSEFGERLRLALTAEKDKLKPVSKVVPPVLSLTSLQAEALQLCDSKPALSKTIEYLRANIDVSSWVESGLRLHENKHDCEFCGNRIEAERMLALREHFSKEVTDSKKAISTLLDRVKAGVVRVAAMEQRDFAPQLRLKLESAVAHVETLRQAYNLDLDRVEEALRLKLANPFEQTGPANVFPSVGPLLVQAIENCNLIVQENNKLSDEFALEKSKSIQKLKRHLASEFLVNEKLEFHALRCARRERHRDRYQSIGSQLKDRISALMAKIDRSQKGRERLNARMATLLGTNTIEISVLSVEGVDRFQLTRRGTPARNLSDGERTAIAFSFFLTKLEEHKELGNVIVYIDDPISSLDSNHVFQVYSMIEGGFFKKVPSQSGSDEWTTSCKQLFISTHNFEFFELLKRLPCNKTKSKFFMIRRLSPSRSTIEDLPLSMLKYRSEYHYLFSVIHAFHISPNKSDIEALLALPNAMRRFLELYTYTRLPWPDSNVEQRAEALFGKEKATRLAKLLHHFSHLESLERLATNTSVIADIENVVGELMTLLQQDKMHFEALEKSLS